VWPRSSEEPAAVLSTASADTFAELERWIAEHLKANLRIDALAARVNMSPRNFARMYSEKRGRTPAKLQR
jgi:transcriptional regulator GlxA family with amidase domain